MELPSAEELSILRCHAEEISSLVESLADVSEGLALHRQRENGGEREAQGRYEEEADREVKMTWVRAILDRSVKAMQVVLAGGRVAAFSQNADVLEQEALDFVRSQDIPSMTPLYGDGISYEAILLMLPDGSPVTGVALLTHTA